ncbi:MerR family transcriptional regulator [Pelosinus propionicus]|uniref:DNA-binding transcriptional regulator, MerR family n=1 Tax=Pelosinus propionicus DSM 13327 TaxID=1123291 RepID=A0A1I4IZD0_9FIRM|nr:MerR family transcriptional regulator [Pelosinus propionicus]SFL59630.1 DNA-binding transcriptional regulator, MerR family [Pelosinus propionicus DSM 13327]
MNDFFQKEFTTGQFAALYGVNKRTLMYYDSIDLFKPAIVKKNGYRYYTYGQSVIFDVIQLLRKLRLPLEEIKKHLAHCTPQKTSTLLYNQSQMLEQEIAELMWLQRVVQNKISRMEAKLEMDYSKIEMIESKAQAIVTSEPTSEISMEQVMKVTLKFMRDCYHTRTYNGYPLGYMMDAEKMQQGDFSQLTNCFYHIDETNSEDVNWTYKPAGRYLVGYYRGSWTDMDPTLQQLTDYANSHGLVFTGSAYLENILDDTAAVEDSYYCEAKISILLK